MAKSSKQVLDFLEDLARRCLPAAREEFSDLEEFAGRKLNAWDMAFYGERLQESRFKVSQEALRPYFPLPKVLRGLFALIQRLYGISVRERPDVGVWHPSVRYYDLLDKDDRVVAGFFLDPYSRSEKRSGAWMDECVVAKALPSGTALPVAQLVCNFTAPVRPRQPSLLTHDEVITLFHEFGHGLHHMLTRVAYPSIAGINGVAWDAVELPSQFMENFVWRAEVLPLISAHVDSGEPLPVDMLQRLLGTRTFNAALDTLRQIELASFDFELHANFDPSAGRKCRRNAGRGAAAGGRRAGCTVQPHAGEFRAHIRRRLCRRLLQLQMGRGAGRRRLRGLRGSRRVRRRDGSAISRFDSGPRRQRRCDGCVRALSRTSTGRAAAAQTDRNRGVNRHRGSMALRLPLLSALPRAAPRRAGGDRLRQRRAGARRLRRAEQPGAAPGDVAFRHRRRDACGKAENSRRCA